MSCQLANLRSRDTGDERQVIVCSPLRFAVASPPANLAVRFWVRIKLAANTVFYSALKTISDPAIIGSIVVITERLSFEVRTRRHHVGEVGCDLLRRAQQI